jgi:hypothetical protein
VKHPIRTIALLGVTVMALGAAGTAVANAGEPAGTGPRAAAVLTDEDVEADPAEVDGPDRIDEEVVTLDPADGPAQELDPSVDVDATVPVRSEPAEFTAAEQAAEAAAQAAAVEAASDPILATFSASGVKYGKPIKRAKVIARAKNWFDRNVQYNQHATAWDVNHGKRYRTDCSGFVSMTWALTSSRNTRNLDQVGTKLNWSSLKAGDMVLRDGHHVQLFEKWTSKAKTAFWIYEEGSTASDMNHRVVKLSTAKNGGYKPWKYKKIAD